jgi:hypothetical protein
MNRRIALKNMAISVWGLVLIPGYQSIANLPPLGATLLALSVDQRKTLSVAVDTLIPKTDTPGAIELNVHAFMEKMIERCYEEDVQKKFAWGLERIEEISKKEFKKTFDELGKEERIKVLEMLKKSSDENERSFFGLFKEIAVLGFSTSEYVLTQHFKYTMTPGHFYGCVPANQN